jgi:NADH-quinone oxidoreductase subunit E
MTNDQTQGSLALVGVLAAGVGLVAFGIAIVVGGWDYAPAAGVGVAVAAAVAVFLFVAMHAPDRAGPNLAAPKPAVAAPARVAEPAPAPASTSPATPDPSPAMTAAPPPAQPAAAMASPAVGKKPEGLAAPRGGKADDLKIIKGIGPKLEELCHRLGYFHFDQIAAWSADEIAWVDDNLEGFRGRVTRDDWVGQAKVLARGGKI